MTPFERNCPRVAYLDRCNLMSARLHDVARAGANDPRDGERIGEALSTARLAQTNAAMAGTPFTPIPSSRAEAIAVPTLILSGA